MDVCLVCFAIAVVLFIYFYRRQHQRSTERLSDISNGVVFITGCDTGFGYGLARRLDGQGVPVIAGCYTDEGSRKLAEVSSSRLRTVSLDITKPESIQAAYEFVRDNLEDRQKLWALVNNAGILGLDGPLEFHVRDDFHRTLLVNYLGPVQTVQTFLPLLKQSKGRIVNVSSIVGKVAAPGMYPYVGSKFAIKGFTEAIRYEMKKIWGIHVCLLIPFGFRTSMLNAETIKVHMTDRWDTTSEEAKRDIGPSYLDEYKRSIVKVRPHLISEDITPVVDAYEHAVLAKHPKNTYVIGKMAKILGFVHDFLPQKISDVLYTSKRTHIMYRISRHQYD